MSTPILFTCIYYSTTLEEPCRHVCSCLCLDVNQSVTLNDHKHGLNYGRGHGKKKFSKDTGIRHWCWTLRDLRLGPIMQDTLFTHSSSYLADPDDTRGFSTSSRVVFEIQGKC